MSRFADTWGSIWSRITSTGRVMPTAVGIPVNQIEGPRPTPRAPVPGSPVPAPQPGEPSSGDGVIKTTDPHSGEGGRPGAGGGEDAKPRWAAFEADADYFQVRVNELYLTDSRRWFSAVDPTVFVVSEFVYDKQERAVPFVVGPGLMKQQNLAVPHGTILRDTRVSGLHPYRGGRLILSVVLCSVEVKDYARRLLGVIEKASGPLGLGAALGSYLDLAEVVLEGFEGLLGLDVTAPLVGLRREFDSAGGDSFTPGYFALIDAPDIDPSTLWVRDNQLYRGPSLEQSAKFTEADFVLYSIVRPPDDRRDDLSILPFYPLWERIRAEANSAREDRWESAKANMLSLYETLELSPDLTAPQRDELMDFYTSRMEAIHNRALKLAHAGPEEEASDPLDRVRERAVSILRM